MPVHARHLPTSANMKDTVRKDPAVGLACTPANEAPDEDPALPHLIAQMRRELDAMRAHIASFPPASVRPAFLEEFASLCQKLSQLEHDMDRGRRQARDGSSSQPESGMVEAERCQRSGGGLLMSAVAGYEASMRNLVDVADGLKGIVAWRSDAMPCTRAEDEVASVVERLGRSTEAMKHQAMVGSMLRTRLLQMRRERQKVETEEERSPLDELD